MAHFCSPFCSFLFPELIEHGRDFDDARASCDVLQRETGRCYVHSTNEPHLIAGVGTAALEIFDELANPDVTLVPIGLGSGICRTAIVAAARCAQTRVIGVQSGLAPAVARSWREKTLARNGPTGDLCRRFATRIPAEMTLEIMRRLMHDIVLVSDEQLREAIGLLLRTMHNLAEGAGAAATAAALLPLKGQLAGKNVVGILSGGNLDLRELSRILES